MKQCFIQIWSVFDKLYLICTRLECLELISRQCSYLLVRLTRYKGREIVLSDGTLIKKNDLLVKIHLHNVRILKEMKCIDKEISKSLFLYKKVQESLPDLAIFIIHHKNNDQIKGIIGITMIDKGFTRLGFESVSFSSFSYFWLKRIALYPIHFLSSTKHSSKKKQIPIPRYLFMSKDIICNKYGADSKNSAPSLSAEPKPIDSQRITGIAYRHFEYIRSFRDKLRTLLICCFLLKDYSSSLVMAPPSVNG